jgi:hypothetical protein
LNGHCPNNAESADDLKKSQHVVTNWNSLQIRNLSTPNLKLTLVDRAKIVRFKKPIDHDYNDEYFSRDEPIKD